MESRSQFVTVTGPRQDRIRYDASGPGRYRTLPPVVCEELRDSVEAIRFVVQSGPTVDYDAFRSAAAFTGGEKKIAGTIFGYYSSSVFTQR